MPELNELNKILIDEQDKLDWRNTPSTISPKIPEGQKLLNRLGKQLSLTEIEFHGEIDGQTNHPGLAYRFGATSTEKTYTYLIFVKDPDDLESFRHYEQFTQCGKSEIIDANWAFSKTTMSCYD